MNVTPTELPGVLILEPRAFSDRRGRFFELWNRKTYEEAGIREPFVQDNVSRSRHGVLRGLHYQVSPGAQGKLVSCLDGEIYDVAVDLRVGSPTFKKSFGIRLSDRNHLSLWIPAGFAHGFLAMAEFSTVLYKATAFYQPVLERGIAWDDVDLGISWPLEGEKPVLNDRDQLFPRLRDVAPADLFAF